MKSFIVALALLAVVSAVALPKKAQKADGPECGAKFNIQKLLLVHKETSLTCELCLDLVQVAEMFAECDESYQQQKMDEYCSNKLGSGSLFDKLCEDLINDIMAELEKDTEADASSVCTKLMKKPCAYDGSK